MAKKRAQRSGRSSRSQENLDQNKRGAAPLPPAGGLDADIHDQIGAAETTGRMIVVDVDGGRSSMKHLLTMVANQTGLGTASSKVCMSSDFGDEPIDEQQAEQADVVVLEEIGVALLQGDGEAAAAAASMAFLADDAGIVVEPEYINYAQVMESSRGLFADSLGCEGCEGQDMMAEQGMGTLWNALRLLCKIAPALCQMMPPSDVAGEMAMESAMSCFQDTPSTTWGLKATGVMNSRFSGAGIRVAVLDTGMDMGHPDFQGRSIQTGVFVPPSQQDNQIQDINGHGTHVIGTSCGPRASQFGPRYGIAFNAEIFAGKVLAHNLTTGRASGGDFNILRGIDWAIRNRCPIINMSLGSPANSASYPQSYETAAQRGLQQGTLILAATGNDSGRPGTIRAVGRPANCPSIAGVAAADNCLRVARFSNSRQFVHTGAEVNFVAPGVRVISSYPRRRGNVSTLNGTSMACPHAAGVAALIAEETGLRGLDLYREMRRRVRNLGNPRDFGHGLVRAG